MFAGSRSDNKGLDKILYEAALNGDIEQLKNRCTGCNLKVGLIFDRGGYYFKSDGKFR